MTPTQILIILLSANIMLTTSEIPRDVMLPQLYAPISYQLHLHLPNELFFTSNSTEFSGKVKIRFSFVNKTNYINLHSRHVVIKLKKITFNNSSVNLNTNYAHNDLNDIITIKLEERITIGIPYELAIEYTANINTEDPFVRNGLYKSTYVNWSGLTRNLLATQFAYTHARTVFPCFDEPGMKATFNVSITFPSGYDAIFNTEEESRVHNNGLTTVVFMPTPRMSTYLLGFVVSEFTCTIGIAGDRVRFRVCSREEYADKRRTALDITPKLLKRYNDFINYNYSRAIGKLDIVALPDSSNEEDLLMVMISETEMVTDTADAVPYFHPGVTDNWGLIMRKESELLYDDSEVAGQKQVVTKTISRQLAHQWFSNLVTFKWWSETFISKGLAAFFETYITNEVIPEWEVEKQFVVNCLHEVLVYDAFENVAPLQFHDDASVYPRDIENSLSEILYNKGGVIMRMVQYFIGLENFRKGIQNYVNKHKFGNVDVKDLWKDMDEVIGESLPDMPANLSTIMENWMKYTGYPILNVTSSEDLITISQTRFLYHRYHLANGQYRRYVPISYTESNETNEFEKTTPDIWMTPFDDSINFTLKSDWVILNQQTGYYRVYYDEKLRDKIRLAMEEESNFGGISEIQRAHLVDDLFNLARANLIQYKEVLEFIRFLEYDTSYYPWKAAIEGFRLFVRRFGEHVFVGGPIKSDVLQLIQNLYLSVPITTIKQDDQIYTLKQQLALEWACRLEDGYCLDDVTQLFKQYKSLGLKPPANLRYVVYCNTLKHSSGSYDWNFLWNTYEHAKPSEQKTIRSALGCSRDRDLLKKYLKASITEGSGFKFIDVMTAFIQTEDNPEAINVAFEFLLDNEKHIIKNYGTGPVVQYIFEAIAVRMDVSDLADYMDEVSRLKKEYRNSVHRAYQTANATKIWADEHHDEIWEFYSNRGFHYWFKVFIFVAQIIAIVGLLIVYRKSISTWCGNLLLIMFVRARHPQRPEEAESGESGEEIEMEEQ